MLAHKSTPDDDDDRGDVRTTRLHDKLLQRIEEMLDELAPRQARARQRDVVDAVRARCAPLFCRQAVCRRAQSCRRDRCTVPHRRRA